jgi:Holliday junction DNA helicase RuvB
MFFDKSKLRLVFSHSVRRDNKLFADIYGCYDIKKLFRMALEFDYTCSILLTGSPASAKTLFLQSLMSLNDSYFIDCSNATKSGIVDYVFEHKPKYLLLDEVDKLSRIDQTFLLNLIETGIVSETKYSKTRKIELKTSVFATSNNTEKIIVPLQSRFFMVNMHAYKYDQFYQITLQLLTSNQYNVDEEIAEATAEVVWDTSRNLRDCLKIASMSKSVEDVNWLVDVFLKEEANP